MTKEEYLYKLKQLRGTARATEAALKATVPLALGSRTASGWEEVESIARGLKRIWAKIHLFTTNPKTLRHRKK